MVRQGYFHGSSGLFRYAGHHPVLPLRVVLSAAVGTGALSRGVKAAAMTAAPMTTRRWVPSPLFPIRHGFKGVKIGHLRVQVGHDVSRPAIGAASIQQFPDVGNSGAVGADIGLLRKLVNNFSRCNFH